MVGLGTPNRIHNLLGPQTTTRTPTEVDLERPPRSRAATSPQAGGFHQQIERPEQKGTERLFGIIYRKYNYHYGNYPVNILQI